MSFNQRKRSAVYNFPGQSSRNMRRLNPLIESANNAFSMSAHYGTFPAVVIPSMTNIIPTQCPVLLPLEIFRELATENTLWPDDIISCFTRVAAAWFGPAQSCVFVDTAVYKADAAVLAHQKWMIDSALQRKSHVVVLARDKMDDSFAVITIEHDHKVVTVLSLIHI